MASPMDRNLALELVRATEAAALAAARWMGFGNAHLVEQAAVDAILSDVSHPLTNRVTIDIHDRILTSRNHTAHFNLSARHHQMYLEGLDLVGASLARRAAIAEFSQAHWAKQPWLESVASVTRNRLR